MVHGISENWQPFSYLFDTKILKICKNLKSNHDFLVAGKNRAKTWRQMGLIGCPILLLLVAQNAIRKILISRIFLQSLNQILNRLFLVFNDTINILCT